MTLLGKIFTGFIAIMSVVFLGLAISVYATHVNWRKVVTNPTPGPGEQRGLKEQLETQLDVNRQLRERQANLTAAIALEQAARRYALAALETKLKALRDEVRVAQQDVDRQFQSVVSLTDEVNQMRRVKSDLENRQRPLQSAVAAMRGAMDKLGVGVEVEQDGTVRTDLDRVPPPVRGEVIDIGEKDLVEISIGSDDGILVGHQLDVYRDQSYLGKVVVLKTSPDRAVAEILPEYKRGTIRKGDRVATKLS